MVENGKDVEKVIKELLENRIIRISAPKQAKYFKYEIRNMDSKVVEKIAEKYGVSVDDVYNMSTQRVARLLTNLAREGLVKMDYSKPLVRYYVVDNK
ncbi:MAG: hypothetical protein ACP5T9_05330 [Thermoplasmata archaeon]